MNPDEIILAPHKAKAAGVASMEIQPKAFRQVIKASGEVQAAQGNESTIVANVAGVVSFALAALLGKVLIPVLRAKKIGQTIYELGPSWHMDKQGVPPMGGIGFIPPFLLVLS